MHWRLLLFLTEGLPRSADTQDDDDDDDDEATTPPANITSAPAVTEAPAVSTPVASAPAVTTPAVTTPAVQPSAAPSNNQQSSEQLNQLREMLANIRPAGKIFLKKENTVLEC